MATPKKNTTTNKTKKSNESKKQAAPNIDFKDIGATAAVTAADSKPASETNAAESPVKDNQSPTQDHQPSITVLIPYLAKAAAGDELKYALRTWEKNFHGDIKVVIVGDKEDWFSTEITHLPLDTHTVDEDCGCDDPKQILNPQADVAHKLLFAITSGAVDGQFILTNDDIFLLGPTVLHDLQQPKVLGNLTDITKKGLYGDNARRTAAVLKSTGKETLNYGTHTPMVLDAVSLADTIRGYNATEKGILLTSAYFNHYQPEPRGLLRLNGSVNGTVLISVYSEKPPLDIVETALRRRKYLNCNSNGWRAIKHLFEAGYPEKSRFEV